ncbi:hypothetical protein [Amycolatopsis sp. H20-H5]|uniref:hypothetical protein n=1 Tax=Amycolatopsis sp. H20-H5 TaxID=3046309 RepID=UPI002DBD0C25|nr:hypothetical protein [Amycolatopsis sp. H20-H5]MEC3982590.1 hypothetical protein [Amycolatopsis sp. H20-H5]
MPPPPPPPPSRPTQPDDLPTEYLEHVMRPNNRLERPSYPPRSGHDNFALPRTPRTLSAGVVLLCLSAALSVATAILIFTMGKQILADYLAGEVSASTGAKVSGDELIGDVAAPYDILVNRGYIWSGFAVVYLVLAVPVRFGQLWANVLLSVLAPLFCGLLVWDMLDSVPILFRSLDAAAIAAAIAALVLIWLGPSNTYRKLRKNAGTPN